MVFKYNEFKKIRKEKRWSLDNLGKAAGVSRRALTNWENGHSAPKESNIKKLAAFLDIPVSIISDLQDTIPFSEKNIKYSATEFMSFYKEDTKNSIKVKELISGIKMLENKLNESSLVINAIITSINSPIYIKDINQKYVLANHNFIENLGLHKNFRITEKTDNDLFSYSDAKKNTIEDKSVLETGNPIINEENFIPGSRKSRWGMISKIPIYDSENKIAGLFGLFYDLTEKTKTENLRKLMETAFLKKSSDILYIYNSKLKPIYISDSFENVYGYPKNKHLLNSEFWINECLHPSYKEQFLNYRHVKDWPESLKYKCIDSKGRIKWIEASTHKFESMNMECLAHFERDISSQKDLVWKNIAMYEIINSLPNTVVWGGTFDKISSFKFDMLTNSIESIFGYSRSDIIYGKIPLLSLFPENIQNLIYTWMIAPKEEFILEHDLKCINGNTFKVNTKIFSIINQENENTFFGIHTIK